VIIERCFKLYFNGVFFPHIKHMNLLLLLAVGLNCSFLFAADSFVVNQTWGQPAIYSKGLFVLVLGGADGKNRLKDLYILDPGKSSLGIVLVHLTSL